MTDYIYRAGKADMPTLLLLHGTGGNEVEMLQIAQQFGSDYNVLSIRGRVADSGVNRYFKMKNVAAGFTKENFDLESLENEAQWLADEIAALSVVENFDSSRVVAIGYSNGANIALYMQLTGIFDFERIIGFHSMQVADVDLPARTQRKIFLSRAENDPIVTTDSFAALGQDLEAAACQLTIFNTKYGHQLTMDEIAAARSWLTE